MSSGKPVWFYFTNAMGSYCLAYPLGFLVMGTYAWLERKKYFKKVPADTYAGLRQRLTTYFFVIVLGMTVPGTKHLRYIVPAIPAIALLAAFLFVNPDKLNLFKKFREIFLKICYVAPFVALGVVIIGGIVLKILDLNIPVPLLLPAIMFITLGFAVVSGTRRVRYKNKLIFIVALTAMTFFVIKIMIIEPIEIYADSSYDFVKKIEKLRPADSKLCFCGIDRDSEALKYLVNLKRDKYYIPTFVELHESEKLLDLPAGTLIVFKSNKTKHVKPEVMNRLEEVAKGKLGHKKCTLYKLK
jgi:4-amino-4-deoxy-L-arabinose transferase-like glycosyltransferase